MRKKFKDIAKERIELSLRNDNIKGLKRLKIQYSHPDYVLCKGCGAQIIKKTGRGMGPTPYYAEITITFDDGSAHETCLCKKCSYNVTNEKAEIYYAIDMRQWINEERGLKPQEDFWKLMATKKVVKTTRGSRVVEG